MGRGKREGGKSPDDKTFHSQIFHIVAIIQPRPIKLDTVAGESNLTVTFIANPNNVVYLSI